MQDSRIAGYLNMLCHKYHVWVEPGSLTLPKSTMEIFMEKRELVTEIIDGQETVVDTRFLGKEWVKYPIPQDDGFSYHPCDETVIRA